MLQDIENSEITEPDSRSKILDLIKCFDVKNLELEMLKADQVECGVVHRFSPGIYVREVSIPAGTFAIGHYQKKEHLNVFLKGKVIMFNEDGSKTELVAPMIFTGQPGRKAGYIVEDVVWLNVYPTEETDVNTIESIYLDKSKGFNEAKKLIEHHEDRTSYQQVINDFGFTEEDVRIQVEDESDQVAMPSGGYKFKIGDSGIHGKGIFATAKIQPQELIGPARIDGKRTPLGRYCNHSKRPNAKMVGDGGNIYLQAIREIQGCEGGFDGDEITTDYSETLKLIGKQTCQQ